MQINPAITAHTANAIRAVISITYHGAIIASISFSLSVGSIINYIAYCSRCTIPEVIGKTASAAANYFVSKGYCLSEASLAFAGIIPREKRQVFPFRREDVPDAGGKLCTQLVFTAIVYIVYTKYTKTAHTANAIRAVKPAPCTQHACTAFITSICNFRPSDLK